MPPGKHAHLCIACLRRVHCSRNLLHLQNDRGWFKIKSDAQYREPFETPGS